jgi:hypothetical protein
MKKFLTLLGVIFFITSCGKMRDCKFIIKSGDGEVFLTNFYITKDSCIEFEEDGIKKTVCGSYTIEENFFSPNIY